MPHLLARTDKQTVLSLCASQPTVSINRSHQVEACLLGHLKFMLSLTHFPSYAAPYPFCAFRAWGPARPRPRPRGHARRCDCIRRRRRSRRRRRRHSRRPVRRMSRPPRRRRPAPARAAPRSACDTVVWQGIAPARELRMRALARDNRPCGNQRPSRDDLHTCTQHKVPVSPYSWTTQQLLLACSQHNIHV